MHYYSIEYLQYLPLFGYYSRLPDQLNFQIWQYITIKNTEYNIMQIEYKMKMITDYIKRQTSTLKYKNLIN